MKPEALDGQRGSWRETEGYGVPREGGARECGVTVLVGSVPRIPSNANAFFETPTSTSPGTAVMEGEGILGLQPTVTCQAMSPAQCPVLPPAPIQLPSRDKQTQHEVRQISPGPTFLHQRMSLRISSRACRMCHTWNTGTRRGEFQVTRLRFPFGKPRNFCFCHNALLGRLSTFSTPPRCRL